jgi:transketolase
VRQSDSDQVTIIGACVTLVEALKAADELAASGINVRVIDPFTIKPLDVETILLSAKQTGGRIVVVEDHYPEGKTSFGCVVLIKLQLYTVIP